MLKKFTKILCAVAMAFVMADVTQAAAEPKLKEARFFGSPDNAPEVKVGAEDGKWVILKSNGILYRFNYFVEANRPLKGIFVGAALFPGTTALAPWGRQKFDKYQRTAWGEGAFFLPNGRIGNDSGKVKAACNDLLAQGKTTTQRHETFAELDLSAAVQVRLSAGGREKNFGRLHGKAMVKVICEAEGMDIKAPPEPISVDVQVEQKGETCPKQTDVKAIIKYKVPMTATFRFKVDGKLSKPITIKARKVGGKPGNAGGPGSGAYYLIERLKTYHLDPGKHTFRVVLETGKDAKSAVKTVKITCPPFKITSASLKYKVAKQLTCPKRVKETTTAIATRPGKAPFVIKTAAGAVVHSGTAVFKRQGKKYVAKIKRHNLMMSEYDSDMMADFTDSPANSGWVRLKVDCMEALSGTLDLRGFKASRCEGEAAFSIRTSIPGKVPYRLDCTNGQSWSGKVEAHETGADTYIAVGVKRFDVSNNEQVNCALKTREPLPYKVLALRGRKYECHKPTDVSDTNDLAPETRPEDPPVQGETLTGDFGFVDHGAPKCPRQGKALITFKSPKSDNIHWSLDCKFFSKSGVLATQPHPEGGYMAAKLVSFDVEKTVDESCTLRTVAPYGPKDHVTKGRPFQCVTPTMPPATTDLVPETRPEPQGSRNPDKVIVVPPRVVIDPPREPKRPGLVVIDPPRTPSDTVPPSYPVPPGGRGGSAAGVNAIDAGKGGGATDATPDYPKKTRGDAEADKKRLELLRRKQALEAQKDAERKRREAAAAAAKKKAEAEARRKREAAKKAAEARRKREAAKKAAELKRKRDAAKKAAEARRKRAAAMKAAQQAAKRKRKAAPKRRKPPVRAMRLR